MSGPASLEVIDLTPPALEVISNSEVETYRQCRLKHQLSYHERWRPDGDEAEALARGTLFHLVMEHHYGRINQARQDGEVVDAEMLYAAVAHDLYDPATGQQTPRQELVEWIYKGYVQVYRDDPDWEIVAIEYNIEQEIFDHSGISTGFAFKGTVDLIVRHIPTGGLYIVDHKTCKNMPKQKDFDMEDQTGIYTYMLKMQDWDIRGAIYNHCRTEKLKRDMTMDERFKRTPTVRTNRELTTIALEAVETMQEAYDRLRRKDALLGVGNWDAPRSPDGERCGWKCGLTEACLAGRKSGPLRTRQFLKDIGYTQHDTKPGPTFNK
jgi:hypothetical protein